MHHQLKEKARGHAAVLGVCALCHLCFWVDGAEVASASARGKLRNDTAIRYTVPEPHLKLARYHYDVGNRLQGFYIAEKARRMFGDEEFTPAFHEVAALRLDYSTITNKTELTQYCREHPNSVEARLLAVDKVLRERPKAEESVQALEKILAEFPQHVGPKAMAAWYFLKTKRDYERALALYLDLYFFDPHHYDGEYAEFRIKQIVSDQKQSWWKVRNKSGARLEDWVSKEMNPRVLDNFIQESRANWKAALVPVMMALLDNDDPDIQSGALHTLLAHPRDVPEVEIVGMLKGEDLIKRGMSAFLVVKCLTEIEYPMLQDNLESSIELVQIDTIQALAGMGGVEGLRFLKTHRPAQMTPRVADMWHGLVGRGLGGAANGSQPIRSETNRTSAAAGSRR